MGKTWVILAGIIVLALARGNLNREARTCAVTEYNCPAAMPWEDERCQCSCAAAYDCLTVSQEWNSKVCGCSSCVGLSCDEAIEWEDLVNCQCVSKC
jgi:hypothetical protein